MMQPAGVNALIALVGAAPAANGASSGLLGAADGSDENATGQAFSQLLSDSGQQYDNQQAAQQFFLQANVLSSNGNGIGALTAQEVPPTQAEMMAQLLEARGETVTKETADSALQQLDAMAQQATSPGDLQAIAEIRQQLVSIQQGGEPKTVAAILQSTPSLKQSSIPVVALTSLLAQKKLPDGVQTKTQETPEVAQQQFVPAAMFPARHAAGAKPAAEKKGASSQEDDFGSDAVDAVSTISGTVTVVEPLAASLTVAANLSTAAPVATGTVISENENDSAANVAAIRPRQDLDAIIPPLTQAEDSDLPVVNLPKMTAESTATKTDKAVGFESLVAYTSGSVDKTDATALAGDKNSAAITSLLNPSHNNGLSPTQTLNAAQPVNVVPTHNYINHAPVSDQVHVAIKQASEDDIERITIQLDPVDLGRVEVKMHKDAQGQTQISFTVDKPETFDSLSRDARHLERSLQEAGIKADSGSMQFNLRQQPQPQLHSDLSGGQSQRQQPEQSGDEPASLSGSAIASISADAATRNYIVNVREGVDISA